MIELIKRAFEHQDRTAIKDESGTYTYQQLLDKSENIAKALLQGNNDLDEARIAFLVPASFDYAAVQWGIWRAGGIAVPLCEKHPLPSIEYILKDTSAAILLYTPEFAPFFSELESEVKRMELPDLEATPGDLPEISFSRRGMILYTSGTTGNPKGVVSTHQNIQSQITALTTSWEWQKEDCVLNVLPLHHVHGIINMLSCALWTGACCKFLKKFDAAAVFEVFRQGEVNVFMAVPTIYFKLITYYQQQPSEIQADISKSLQPFRLMVSGSAALPVSVLEQWRTISGHTLLERYGMTEMGMAISNPYRGERKPGYIGQPLSGVTIRLANESGQEVTGVSQGEIQVKGANVFQEYWEKPEATADTFTQDGWFKTGDIAVYENGSYRILGRNSVDIIKSGGYKISALEIEEVLRSHPEVKDCGVVGIPDLEWGEIIGAAIIPENNPVDEGALKSLASEKLAGYKHPRKYITLEDLPRNVMGKVTKKELLKFF